MAPSSRSVSPGRVPARRAASPASRQRRADPQPVQFLLRLDGAQPDVFRIQPDHLEVLLEDPVLGDPQRAHDADALRAAVLQLPDHLIQAVVRAPVHFDVAGNFLRERKMVDPLDRHPHLLARPENDVGLDRSRPAGDPLRRIARAVVGDEQQVIHACLFHHGRERLVPARILGVGEAGVLLPHDCAQVRRELQRERIFPSLTVTNNKTT